LFRIVPIFDVKYLVYDACKYFMICVRTNFHLPSASGSSVIAMEPRGNSIVTRLLYLCVTTHINKYFVSSFADLWTVCSRASY